MPGACWPTRRSTRPATHYGFSGPQEVFDTAERLGRAHALDTICRTAIVARAASLPPDALLFLNVSPQTLEHGVLAGDTLVAAVAAAGLAPERVVLEITERSLAQLPAVVREALRLRGLGFRLALDDVGAGNAGLEMLSQVPVDFIKVDRAVVAQAATDTTADAVLAAVVAFAAKTGSRVVAEGIETVAMVEHVRGAGVACAQGYLLGRPDAALAPTPALPQTLSA
jgi:EAL domain-containing protein (putative c-di-GMP-specific phosphodiesterase class I)